MRRLVASSAICALVLLVLAESAIAEVVRIDVRRRDDAGTHERVIGRVHFAIDPTLPANRGIADLDQAPRNAAGRSSSHPTSSSSGRRTPAAHGARCSSKWSTAGGISRWRSSSGAQQRSLSPESWNLGDGFLLEQGFAVAFLGWQFDVQPSQGLTFTAPIAPVEGLVRASQIELARPGGVDIRADLLRIRDGTGQLRR